MALCVSLWHCGSLRWPHGLVCSSGLTGTGSSPGWGHCVMTVLEQDTSLSQCLCPSRCINITGTSKFIAGGNPIVD